VFKNYLKTAWRNIARNKTTTLINLFGLSVALVAFIFISLWVAIFIAVTTISFQAIKATIANPVKSLRSE